MTTEGNQDELKGLQVGTSLNCITPHR